MLSSRQLESEHLVIPWMTELKLHCDPLDEEMVVVVEVKMKRDGNDDVHQHEALARNRQC